MYRETGINNSGCPGGRGDSSPAVVRFRSQHISSKWSIVKWPSKILPDFTPLETQSQSGSWPASFLYFTSSFLLLGKQRPTPVPPLWVSESLVLLVFAFLGVLSLRGDVWLSVKIGLYEAADRLLFNCIVNQYEDHFSASKEKLHYHYKVSTLMIVNGGVFLFPLVFWCPLWSPQ